MPTGRITWMWATYRKLPLVEGTLLVNTINELVRQRNKSEHKSASAEAPEEGTVNVSAEFMVEKSTLPQKRADTFTAITEHYLATANVDDENGGLTPLAGHERCQVVLHMDAKTLKQQYEQEHGHGDSCECHQHVSSHINGQWISDENARRFSSDASLYTVLLDDKNNVLNTGNKTRTLSLAIRRALNIRDETCCFPGCCEKHYVDFHHVLHWSRGGESNPHNLLKLCRFHHTQLHLGGYSIELQEQTEQNNNQKWLFKTATGEVIVRNPVLPPCNPKDFFGSQWSDIDRDTRGPRRQGKVLNYQKNSLYRNV